MSPDPGDDHLIDCAMNANATIITWNLRDFSRAQQSLGLRVQTPTDYLVQYAKTLEESEGTEE
jgi:predicted nucleic acid-binding protein